MSNSKQQTLRIDCGEAARAVLQGSASDFFQLVQLAWNLREIVRLLTPGNSEVQFHDGIDPLWIKESNKLNDEVFKRLGLSMKEARRLFAPKNCPDLVVPHVAFETEQFFKQQGAISGRAYTSKPNIKEVPRKKSSTALDAPFPENWIDCTFTTCTRCKGIDRVSGANYRKIARKHWPQIFGFHRITLHECSCNDSVK